MHRLPVLHSQVPLRCAASIRPNAASCANATCATAGWRPMKRPPACRPVPMARSPSASFLKRKPRSNARQPVSACCPEQFPRPTPSRPRSIRRDGRFPPMRSQPTRILPRGQPAHWPLIWMLLLTQLAAGLSLLACVLGLLRPQLFAFPGAFAVCSCVLLQAGLASSVFHLGRPLRRVALVPGLAALLDEPGDPGLRGLCGRYDGVDARGLLARGAGLDPDAEQRRGGSWPGGSLLFGHDLHRHSSPFLGGAPRTLPRFLGATLLLGAAGGAVLLSSLSHFAGTGANGAAHWPGGRPRPYARRCSFGRATSSCAASPARVHATHRSARFVWHRRRSLVWTRLALFICATGFGCSL